MKWKRWTGAAAAVLVMVVMVALMMAPGTQPVRAGAASGEAAGQTVVPNTLAENVGVTPVAVTVITETVYFNNNGLTWCEVVNNDDTNIITGTFETTATSYGLAVADVSYNIPAGSTYVIGPFTPGLYNDSDSDVKLTWSAGDSAAIAPTPQSVRVYRITP